MIEQKRPLYPFAWEVALLIRRFIHKLGVKRDKIQFILTSASGLCITARELHAQFVGSHGTGD